MANLNLRILLFFEGKSTKIFNCGSKIEFKSPRQSVAGVCQFLVASK